MAIKTGISLLFHSMLVAVHLLHHIGREEGLGVSQMLTLWDRGGGGGLKNYDT